MIDSSQLILQLLPLFSKPLAGHSHCSDLIIFIQSDGPLLRLFFVSGIPNQLWLSAPPLLLQCHLHSVVNERASLDDANGVVVV